MPLTNQMAGKPISAEEAQNYIAMQVSLKKCLNESLLKMIPSDQKTATPLMRDANKYFDSDVNAFIFSKEAIMRFFEPADNTGPMAEYIMVIMGAKYLNNDEKGNPTVVVAGVIEDTSKPNTYLSLDIEYPATEQPPRQTIATFPIHEIAGEPKHIEFKIL